MAALPLVLSVAESPLWPPLSCQQPLMTLDMDKLFPMIALGTGGWMVDEGSDGVAYESREGIDEKSAAADTSADLLDISS